MSDVVTFLGRLHPAVVHLPVGLALLAPALLIAARRRPALRVAVGPVLFAAAMTAAVSAGLGLALRSAGDHPGPLAEQHQLWGFATTGVLTAAWILHSMATRRPRFGALAVLTTISGVVCVTIAGHQGGALTHGPNYLTQYAPPALRRLIEGPSPADAPDPLLYAAVVQPMLDETCASCHCADKAKGGLRLDGHEWILRGSTNGPAVVAGDPEKGELLRRVTMHHEEKGYMPPEGRKPLAPGEIDLLRHWIAGGASVSQTVFGAGSLPAGVQTVLERRLPRLARARAERQEADRKAVAAVQPMVEQLRRDLGVTITPVSREDALLVVSSFSRPQHIGDAEAERLAGLGAAVVQLDLRGTRLGDAGLARLRNLNRLERLQLAGTTVSATGLASIAAMPALRTLNLYGVALDDRAADTLASATNLVKVHLADTGLSTNALQRMRQKRPDLLIVGNEEPKGPES